MEGDRARHFDLQKRMLQVDIRMSQMDISFLLIKWMVAITLLLQGVILLILLS